MDVKIVNLKTGKVEVVSVPDEMELTESRRAGNGWLTKLGKKPATDQAARASWLLRRGYLEMT